MGFDLSTVVNDFARGMMLADSRQSQAMSPRSKKSYQPGLGPHTEKRTVKLVMKELIEETDSSYQGLVELEVSYPNQKRAKCDLCLGSGPGWEWALEIKMLRIMGDNGKVNDNILMHILSPYPQQRSAVTDCAKLLASGLEGRKAILIYGYDYDEWPMDPAIEAFELLASRDVRLSERLFAPVTGLIHPVHQRGHVFGWEIFAR